MKNYSLIQLDNLIVTQGLNNFLGKEFSINKGIYSEEDIRLIIDYILEYLISTNSQIKDLETFGCGSWLIQFIFQGEYIELHELKDVMNDTNIYEFDISNTILFLKEQYLICLSKNQTPIFPSIGQKIAISKEIYEGSEVNGVRYNAPSHMSGWYLTSNSYNGNINSLLVVHLFHLLKSRPDLAKFLALPSGYRFYKDKIGEDIWTDSEI